MLVFQLAWICQRPRQALEGHEARTSARTNNFWHILIVWPLNRTFFKVLSTWVSILSCQLHLKSSTGLLLRRRRHIAKPTKICASDAPPKEEAGRINVGVEGPPCVLFSPCPGCISIPFSQVSEFSHEIAYTGLCLSPYQQHENTKDWKEGRVQQQGESEGAWCISQAQVGHEATCTSIKSLRLCFLVLLTILWVWVSSINMRAKVGVVHTRKCTSIPRWSHLASMWTSWIFNAIFANLAPALRQAHGEAPDWPNCVYIYVYSMFDFLGGSEGIGSSMTLSALLGMVLRFELSSSFCYLYSLWRWIAMSSFSWPTVSWRPGSNNCRWCLFLVGYFCANCIVFPVRRSKSR